MNHLNRGMEGIHSLKDKGNILMFFRRLWHLKESQIILLKINNNFNNANNKHPLKQKRL